VPITSAPRVLVDGGMVGPAAVVFSDGVVTDVLDGVPAAAPDHVALDSGVLTAGMVDVQINGAYGVDFVKASEDEYRTVARTLPSTGVTAFQPTYITAPVETLVAGLERAAAARDRLRGEAGARILGVHLEGPFLSPDQAGVHPVAHMRHPSPALLDQLLAGEASRRMPSTVTLAPELPGGLDAIRRLTAAGVRVSVGHSNALAADVRAAADAGATMVTHLFNAQRGLGHREPGVAGQALADSRLTVGLIADLHHVVGEVCAIVMRAAPGRVALVTDAIAAAGMPPGHYELGGIEVGIAENDVPRTMDGTIAGSALTLDRAVRNLIGVGCDPVQVLRAATETPANALGRADLGRLVAGALADLVWWSDDFHPRQAWVGGAEVYSAREALTASP
jgi:N-acetylglucosamine-6-phosphate deacetylase